jgi:hypothetical protein
MSKALYDALFDDAEPVAQISNNSHRSPARASGSVG